MKFLQKIKRFFIHAGAICVFPFYYLKLHKMRKNDDSLVVLLPRYGDMTYGMMYLPEFKKETSRSIACLCCEKNVRYVESYNCVDRIITYPNKLFYQTLLYSVSGFKFFFVRSRPNFKYIYTTPPQYFFNNANCCDIYRDVVYRVKEDKFSLLQLKNIQINSIADFDKLKDRIVIINAFTTSHKKNCDDVMQKAADLLKSKGYIVYCNLIGNQQPLQGTQPLYCSVDELYEICNHCKAFISIRSGIVDFTLGTKCKKIVVYMKRNLLKIHSIAKFNKNIIEVEILKEDDESLFLECVNSL